MSIVSPSRPAVVETLRIAAVTVEMTRATRDFTGQRRRHGRSSGTVRPTRYVRGVVLTCAAPRPQRLVRRICPPYSEQ